MTHLTLAYYDRAEVWLMATTLAYFLMNGAQVYETAVIVPKWTKSPPESLAMFKGKYSPDLKTFWVAIHSIHELTFIAAIVFCWDITNTRNWLLALFAAHFAVRVWTILYFAPNIINFQKVANGREVDFDLSARARSWKNWNYLRVSLFIIISMLLLRLGTHLLKP